MSKLTCEFYRRPCLRVARELVGKILVHRVDGVEHRLRITETEAYCGESDTACHASKGRTQRTEVMYAEGGAIYIYLCYGIHWMLNIVTGQEGHPEAVLIRACEGKYNGPGKLTRAMGITGRLNRGSIVGEELWIEDDGCVCEINELTRVGIGYASPEDQSRLWRFQLQ